MALTIVSIIDKDKMMTEYNAKFFSTSVSLFRDLLAGASVAAGKGRKHLPVLSSVQIKVSDGEITGASTDRYRLSVGTIVRSDVTSVVDGDASAIVPLRDVKELLKSLPKNNKNTNDKVNVTITERTMRVDANTSDGSWSREITLFIGDFPKWESLVPTSFDGIDSDGMYLNPAFLADISKLPVTGSNTPVRIRQNGATKPLLADFPTAWEGGVSWMYLLMPVRMPV